MTCNHSRLLRCALSLLTVLSVQFALAQVPSGYYSNAEGKTGEDLRAALHNIIKNHTVISYDALRSAYWATDNRGNGIVWDIYSDVPNGTAPYTFRLGQDECGTYDMEGDCYNREHIWPQSWFNERSPMKSDLFHVMPTDGYVNGKRSNYPHGDVGNATWTSRNGSKLGRCSDSGYSGTVFEPIDEYKGDIARAYFYMSTRYYGEDSSWDVTAMTDGADLKDWAVATLLHWHEIDPVSQKEIDRNNTIYEDYQHNRNPFIDHPEYANMIWDPNWQGGAFYAVTTATSTHGSVVADVNSAREGQTVTLSPVPEVGYELQSWNVYKTGSASVKVNVSSNNTFTMPAYAVTVSATFRPSTTYYAIHTEQTSHGSISVNVVSALPGTTVTMTASPENGYGLYSWYVYKTGNMNMRVPVNGNTFVMPSYDVTVNASFSTQGSNSSYYQKVVENLSDWSGRYLIVYENGNSSKAFNGSLTTLDVASNGIPVSISSDIIAVSETTTAAEFTIAPAASGTYSIKSASGYYIGNNGDSNGLSSSTSTVYANTLKFDNGNASVKGSGGAYLRFNSNADQVRFRYFKSSTYTSQKPIQLYKRIDNVHVPQHTLHFDPNGGSGEMSDLLLNENESENITLNAFTRIKHLFVGWNTQANGTGTFYSDGAQVTLFNDLTLYAQWEQQYDIVCAEGIAHGRVSSNKLLAVYEESVTLTAVPDDGYKFNGWRVKDCYGNAITVNDDQFEMPACNVTVSAVFAIEEKPFVPAYYLVTSEDMLIAGRSYLIVSANYQKALGAQNTNNRAAADITVSSDSIISDKKQACELVLGGTEGRWTLYDGNGFLYAASSSSNYLRNKTDVDANAQWAIRINDGKAVMQAQGSNTRNIIRHNSGSNIFSCYASGQNDVCLFIRSEEYDIDDDMTIPSLSLFAFDRCVVREGVTLTITEELSNDVAENLVIKDGGQLVHDNDGVAATFEKEIHGYTAEKDMYYFLASPFVSCDYSCVKVDEFDFYSYDEPTHYWINQQYVDGAMRNTVGYLYANSEDQLLRLSGKMISSEEDVTVSGLSCQSDELHGFNLVGNPFACEAYIEGDYFVIGGSEVVLNENYGQAIKPCEAVFVVASQEATSVTFSRNASQKKSAAINIAVQQHRNQVVDRARVRIDEGADVEKFMMNPNGTHLYFKDGGTRLAVAHANGSNEMPLSFKASQNGRYTINVTADFEDVSYLHLIDNKTGADVDLLSSPSYSFDASTDDYSARFKLIFYASDANGDDSFAFQNGSSLVVPATEGNSMLQVFDAKGQLVETMSLDGSLNKAISLAPGLYLLILRDASGTRVQKIVWK